MSVQWCSRKRDYSAEQRQYGRTGLQTTDHPLKKATVQDITPSKRLGWTNSLSRDLQPLGDAFDGGDPLTALSQPDPLGATDPLSQAVLHMSLSKDKGVRDELLSPTGGRDDYDDFESWSDRRLMILSKFTTSEKLSIATSFLPGSGGQSVSRSISNQPSVSEKVKNRLEQLDVFDEGSVKEMLNLTQQEYMNKIEDLNEALVESWDADQRVKSLKIVIQCAKMLSDVNVIKFYPSKFVLITDILDTFCTLVYGRLREKSAQTLPGMKTPQKLPVKFSPSQVPESAKETCRNWFYKIASIRELIPRLYVEASLLKCYSFLTSEEFGPALRRLVAMVCGIGDPLVATFARAYLCRVGNDIAPELRDHLTNAITDFTCCYKQVSSEHVKQVLSDQNVDMSSYIVLYTPALDWILSVVSFRATDATLNELLNIFKSQTNCALLLNSIIQSINPDFICKRALNMLELINTCDDEVFPKHFLHQAIGRKLVRGDLPESERLPALNIAWKVIMRLREPSDYIQCAEVWMEFAVKYFTHKEINRLLADVVKHMTPDRAFEDHYYQLQSILSKILEYQHSFSEIFSMDKFMPFLDMFQKDSVKVDAFKSIVDAFKRHQLEPTDDPVVLNALMYLCKTLHDSVNALSADDEQRLLGSLICSFVRKISFGQDFEQQLSFYVESRAAFTNLDPVMIELVNCVNQLTIKTVSVVNGQHTRKTAAFVRACIAYSFITIPSIEGVFEKLKLYLISGQIALQNQALSQADAFFKAAISQILEVPRMMVIDHKMRNTEPYIVDYLNGFFSTLLVVPDSPDQGVLYLIRGVLNVIESYPWDDTSDSKFLLYMNVLCLMSSSSQDSYLYHIDQIESNDTLYGTDPKYINEINTICQTLLGRIIEHLKYLGKLDAFKRQSALALHVFNKIVTHGDLGGGELMVVASNIWNLAQKHGVSDTRLGVRTLDYVKGRAADGTVPRELVQNMALQTRT